ncbi:MAG TPA: GGDEF domain-containing protein [Gammaproteobacteria bacterium]|jgi:diguanylate cyclase|nr:GGDEF domain-containing protein [Candidatus Hydrogenedentota bacterium]HJP35837.1 GGDEF domain-containing protein [Gammaproteobacteria bacterium]
MVYILGGVAAVFALAAVYFFSASRAKSQVPHAKPAAPQVKAKTPGDEPNGKNSKTVNAALEKNKLAVYALLHGLAENVGALLEESAEYDDAMRMHREAVEKAKSLVNFDEVERSLLEQVGKMIEVNQEYRDQLKEANKTVDSQREELEKLQTNIEVDFLTEIPNRRGYDRRITEIVALAKHNGTHACLVVVDLDHFKQVNDKYGHWASDRILRAISAILKEHKRATDFLARYGGEEFVLLLPETNLERAKILAERAREKVENSRFRLEDRSLSITVSMGVGQIDPIHDTFFERVDATLY